VLRMIDSFIASLQSLRHDIADEDVEALKEKLQRASAGRERWWRQRLTADYSSEAQSTPELPTASEMFGRLLGMNRKRKRER
jgi:hypothetical protein